MRLGVNIPNFGDLPEVLSIGTMAREAEIAGADSVWLADHILLVDEPMTGYPYTSDGVFPEAGTFPFYDALASSAFVAAVTKHCRIGIGVLVLPQRNLLELAKVASTIDRLSGGRFTLGVGSGWNRLEMEALGYSFKTRGKRTDEMLQVLRDCWQGTPNEFNGQHVSIPENVMLFPRPSRDEGVPLLVGGMGDVSLRRAAGLGDGWMAIAAVEDLDIVSLREKVEHVRTLRAAKGGAEFELVLKLEAEPSSVGVLPQAVADMAALGFDEVVVDVPWSHGTDRACEVIEACCSAARSA